MTLVRSSSLALVESTHPSSASESVPAHRGRNLRHSDRRAHARVDPLELPEPLTARVKYGDSLTLVDVSAGGALVESPSALRPDSTLVLEVMAGAEQPVSVVSRILRCHVSDVRGGIRYRGACVFKRPLEHPALIAASPLLRTPPADFLRPEFALKKIVEAYRRRKSGSPAPGGSRDADALVDALGNLREAAAQRLDPIERTLANMLGSVLPILERNESSDDVKMEVLVQLQRHIPALTIRVGALPRTAEQSDQERLTLDVWSEPSPNAMVTAEFPVGFDLEESQFRLLKTGAYLLGLAESWSPATADAALPAPNPAPAIVETTSQEQGPLPPGWQRVVVRFVDGKLLRGYSNTFHPDSAHLHLSPEINCAAGERLFVPIARLKAVFFVRDLAGNAEHVYSNTFDHAPRARKVEVTFRDGEVMAGSTLNYKPQGQGFFLTPANSQGNNERVYVVLAAVRHLRFV